MTPEERAEIRDVMVDALEIWWRRRVDGALTPLLVVGFVAGLARGIWLFGVFFGQS